jgi:hypothetical protein
MLEPKPQIARRLIYKITAAGATLPILPGYPRVRAGPGPDEFTATTPDQSRHPNEDFNSGIAIIFPAKDILGVLNQDKLVSLRAAERYRVYPKHGGGAVLD